MFRQAMRGNIRSNYVHARFIHTSSFRNELISSVSSDSRLFDYSLNRRLLDQAARATYSTTGVKVNAIIPNGFEVFGEKFRKVTPKRHYPIMGFWDDLSFQDASELANVMQSHYLWKLRSEYPQLADCLEVVQIHQDGFFQRRLSGEINVSDAHIVYLQPVWLKPEQSALDCYANYIATMMASFAGDEAGKPPQYIDFFSKTETGSHYLHQLAIQAMVIAEDHLGFKLPALTAKEKALYKEMFIKMRNRPVTDLVPGRSQKNRLVEFHQEVMRELILPRMAIIQDILRGNDSAESKEYTSEALYNGDAMLYGRMLPKYYRLITTAVTHTYQNFVVSNSIENDQSIEVAPKKFY